MVGAVYDHAAGEGRMRDVVGRTGDRDRMEFLKRKDGWRLDGCTNVCHDTGEYAVLTVRYICLVR